MLSDLRSALVLLLVATVGTGLVYPAVVTGVAGALFPLAARGSVVEQGGKVRGSDLVGQSFTDPAYFWGRPSATAPFAYNAGASTGSNQGPTNPALLEAVRVRVDALRAADPGNVEPVPVDLVTASGSGLDPHVSPAAALYQVGRVARARGVDRERVRRLVDESVEGRTLGVFGAPRVNVLRLNLALDRLAPKAPPAQPSRT